MKNPFKFGFTLACVFVLLQSCSENDPAGIQKYPAKIAFTLPESPSLSSIISSHDLIISVEDLNGKVILSNHKLTFSNGDGSFMTEDLNLASGTYVITDLRLEKDEEIIFDVPGQETNVSPLDDTSLPYRFTVSGDNTSTLSFKMTPAKAKHKFSLAVWIEGAGGLEYTSATAYLKDGDNVVATYALGARMNYLGFDLDHKKEYTLLVSKEGYSDFTQPFIYKNIKHNPINVILTPVSNTVTLKGRTDFDGTDHFFKFQIWSDPGAITADIGGAASTHYFSEGNYWFEFARLHTDPQEYDVTITGDLDKVTEFTQTYSGRISEADLSGFTNIKQIHMSHHPLTSIDFSANTKLQSLYFYGMPTLTDVTLPEDHFIQQFVISGNTGLSAAEVDEAIDNVYTNAISKNIVNGVISISTEYYGGSEMLGPPSEASMAKLAELRDVHGWNIWPPF